MMTTELKRLDQYRWEVPRSGKMRVPGLIYTHEARLEDIQRDTGTRQVAWIELP